MELVVACTRRPELSRWDDVDVDVIVVGSEDRRPSSRRLGDFDSVPDEWFDWRAERWLTLVDADDADDDEARDAPVACGGTSQEPVV